jgi:hypothetical protein
MLLRESGLKKIGFSTQNPKLWDLQKQAHQEVEQKHSAEAKQIKDLTDQLDLSRQSFKEIHDSGQKMLEFLKETANLLSSHMGRSFSFKPSKESLHLSLQSNHSQQTIMILNDFSVLKEKVLVLVQEMMEKSKNDEEKNDGLKNEIVQMTENQKKLKEQIKISEEQQEKLEKILNEAKKSYLKDLEEQKNLLKSFENKKNREIDDLRERYEKELRILEDEKNFTIENFSASIKNSHRKELKDLELSFKVKENSLLEELDMATNSDTQVLKTLRENLEKLQIKVQDLREVLRAVCERSTSLFQKFVLRDEIEAEFLDRKEEVCHISDNKIWKQYAELLTQIDFMGLAFKKLSSDNEWLVEQIDELSKANSRDCKFYLEEKPRFEERVKDKYEQVINTLTANESVIKDFQDARNRLLKQFADAKRLAT